ncbi:MAG: alkaline phosphatase family protein [Candidatus Methanofastidiosia archaeon]
MKRYLKLWILPFILVVLSLGVQNLALSAWNSVVDFNAPEFSVEPGGKSEALTHQVVIVVVDALRVDTFNKMKYLSGLKQNGAFFVLKTGEPSLSLPGWTVISTGAYQEITGVTTNWFEGPVSSDSIFSEAETNGLQAAIVGTDGWEVLFSNVTKRISARKWDSYITFDEETLSIAFDYLKENPNLLLVHFVDTDESGHQFGGASSEYQGYADHIDTLIEELLRNLSKDTILIITADHGTINTGGHGGWEDVVTYVPLLIYGKGIKIGDFGRANQTDIAPTVSILLGIPIPSKSQGNILFDALDLDEGKKAELSYLLLNQKLRFAEGYTKSLGMQGPPIASVPENLSFKDVFEKSKMLDENVASQKKERIRSEQISNIPLFLIVLLLPIIAFWYLKKRFSLSYKIPFSCSLLYLVFYNAIFFGSGKNISLSSINQEANLAQFFNTAMAYAAVSVIISVLILSFIERKKTRYEVARDTVLLSAFVAFLLALQIDLFFLYNGPLIKWYIPNMFLTFKYYLDMLTFLATGFVSVVLPFISMGFVWVLRKTRV